MPDLLASGNTTVFHYEANTTPPANYADWGQVNTQKIKIFGQNQQN